jgi:hypothetical protein
MTSYFVDDRCLNLDGHMSSAVYHKLENLCALKDSSTKCVLVDLLISKVNDENYNVLGVIENRCRRKVTVIKYILPLTFVRNIIWIVNDLEIV